MTLKHTCSSQKPLWRDSSIGLLSQFIGGSIKLIRPCFLLWILPVNVNSGIEHKGVILGAKATNAKLKYASRLCFPWEPHTSMFFVQWVKNLSF